MRWARRLLWPMLLFFVMAAVLFVGVFPTRTYLNQRDETRQNQAKLTELLKRNSDLEAQVAKLKTPEEVERLARLQYHLIKPGETPFAVLPGVATTVPPDGVTETTLAPNKVVSAPKD